MKIFALLLLAQSYQTDQITTLSIDDCDVPVVCEDIKLQIIQDENNKLLEQLLMEFGRKECISNKEDYKKKGISIPKCGDNSALIGLDNTYPTAGLFVNFWDIFINNEVHSEPSFLKQLIPSYLDNDKIGVFNIIIPYNKIKSLQNLRKVDKDFDKILSTYKERINIIPVRQFRESSLDPWTQDFFQFVIKDGEVGIVQLDHAYESHYELKDRLACEVAKACNIPYFFPTNNPTNWKSNAQTDSNNTLNRGGNIEFLPGNIPYTGKARSIPTWSVRSIHDPVTGTMISEDTTVEAIKEAKQKPLELNSMQIELIDFLKKDTSNDTVVLNTEVTLTSHVDEIINVVKTNDEAPCDYAILVASPKKGYELLDNYSQKTGHYNFLKGPHLFAQLTSGDIECGGESIEIHTPYPELSDNLSVDEIIEIDQKIFNQSINNTRNLYNTKELIKRYDAKCIGNITIENFLQEQGIRKYNLETTPTEISVHDQIQANLNLILNALKERTSCKNPEVIEIPVILNGRDSITPNLVNSVVQTSPGQASTIIAPLTFNKPFDDYFRNTLEKKGIKVIMMNDYELHLGSGDIHCATNSALICE